VGEFEDKCLEILEGLRGELGEHAFIFFKKVDAKLVPDYYKVIRKPMWLDRIRANLQSHAYTSPQDFYDVSLPTPWRTSRWTVCMIEGWGWPCGWLVGRLG
jgi:Bromodomain